MLGVLIKKQLMEAFKGYFFDQKKNKMRSKGAIACWFAFFIIVMVFMLGGMFTGLSLSICGGMIAAGVDWMYFFIMGMMATFLGAFGSVFNTYSGLYLSKDNDMLLAMPIPIKTIVTARLANVFLLGTMYASVVTIPAMVIYWMNADVTVSVIIGSLIFWILTAVIVFLLSCGLGFLVAKASLKLKNKSVITALISLVFIGGYYYLCANASNYLQTLVNNAQIYGEKVKGAAYFLYIYGSIGTGDLIAGVIALVISAALILLIGRALERSFLEIVSEGSKVARVKYVEKPIKEKTLFGAVLAKEFKRFTASSAYMLNCALGAVILPFVGVVMLIKGPVIVDGLNRVFDTIPDTPAVLICAFLCLSVSLIDIATPSVSLEGKSIWIPQSLPISSKLMVRGKLMVQLIIAGVAVILTAACVVPVLNTSIPVALLFALVLIMYTVLLAMFDMVIGLKMPILNWTNEVMPIKQSGGVIIALFGGWIFVILMGVGYMLGGYVLGATVYLLIWAVLFAFISFILFRWLETKGASIFENL